MTNILICGFGSIGQKHAKNLTDMGANLRVWRHRQDQKEAIINAGYVFEPSLENGLDWADAAIIATATDQHIAPATLAAQKNVPYYMEKPVSLNTNGLRELEQNSRNLPIEIGCQLRHHPSLVALKHQLTHHEYGKVLSFQAWVGQRLDEWRPGSDYRKCYSADTTRGGGALFDLVHEIDLMTWLVGPMDSVYADLRHNSDLDMNAEDLANIVLSADNKAAGTVQLDMLSPAYRRGLQIICEKCVYTFDMKEGILWRKIGSDDVQCIAKPDKNFQPADMLKNAVEYFINRVKDPTIAPRCGLEDGIHDLHILLAAKQSNSNKAQEKIRKTL